MSFTLPKKLKLTVLEGLKKELKLIILNQLEFATALILNQKTTIIKT